MERDAREAPRRCCTRWLWLLTALAVLASLPTVLLPMVPESVLTGEPRPAKEAEHTSRQIEYLEQTLDRERPTPCISENAWARGRHLVVTPNDMDGGRIILSTAWASNSKPVQVAWRLRLVGDIPEGDKPVWLEEGTFNAGFVADTDYQMFLSTVNGDVDRTAANVLLRPLLCESCMHKQGSSAAAPIPDGPFGPCPSLQSTALDGALRFSKANQTLKLRQLSQSWTELHHRRFNPSRSHVWHIFVWFAQPCSFKAESDATVQVELQLAVVHPETGDISADARWDADAVLLLGCAWIVFGCLLGTSRRAEGLVGPTTACACYATAYFIALIGILSMELSPSRSPASAGSVCRSIAALLTAIGDVTTLFLASRLPHSGNGDPVCDAILALLMSLGGWLLPGYDNGGLGLCTSGGDPQVAATAPGSLPLQSFALNMARWLSLIAGICTLCWKMGICQQDETESEPAARVARSDWEWALVGSMLAFAGAPWVGQVFFLLDWEPMLRPLQLLFAQGLCRTAGAMVTLMLVPISNCEAKTSRASVSLSMRGVMAIMAVLMGAGVRWEIREMLHAARVSLSSCSERQTPEFAVSSSQATQYYKGEVASLLQLARADRDATMQLLSRNGSQELLKISRAHPAQYKEALDSHRRYLGAMLAQQNRLAPQSLIEESYPVDQHEQAVNNWMKCAGFMRDVTGKTPCNQRGKDSETFPPRLEKLLSTVASKKSARQKCASSASSVPIFHSLKSLARVRPQDPNFQEVLSALQAGRKGPREVSEAEKRLQSCPSCAVVGSSMDLLSSGLGTEIDSHQVVIRLGCSPVLGFAADVGMRTTHRIIVPPTGGRGAPAVCPGLADVQAEGASLLVDTQGLSESQAQWLHKLLVSTARSKASLSQGVHPEAVGFLDSATLQVESGGSEGLKLSTQLTALLVAIRHCSRPVQAYGLSSVQTPSAPRLERYFAVLPPMAPPAASLPQPMASIGQEDLTQPPQLLKRPPQLSERPSSRSHPRSQGTRRCGWDSGAVAMSQTCGNAPASDRSQPCCSASGYCQEPSIEACECPTCVDYRRNSSKWSNPRIIGLIVPFRDREEDLEELKLRFRTRLDSGLRHWRHTYVVVVVEQFDLAHFNRGYLFNVGYSLFQQGKIGLNPDCLVVHDVDMYPEPEVDYGWCQWPIHLSAALDRFGFGSPYPTFAGGVVSMPSSRWKEINGFSNSYNGWGAEDDDLFIRLSANKRLFQPRPGSELEPLRPTGHRGWFMSGSSETHTPRDKAYGAKKRAQDDLLRRAAMRWRQDGISSTKFTLLKLELEDTSHNKRFQVYRALVGIHGQQSDARMVPRVQIRWPVSWCPSTALVKDTAPSAVPENGDQGDCWEPCGQRAGPCKLCGEGRACCRKHWPSDPPICWSAFGWSGIIERHECVGFRQARAGSTRLKGVPEMPLDTKGLHDQLAEALHEQQCVAPNFDRVSVALVDDETLNAISPLVFGSKESDMSWLKWLRTYVWGGTKGGSIVLSDSAWPVPRVLPRLMDHCIGFAPGPPEYGQQKFMLSKDTHCEGAGWTHLLSFKAVRSHEALHGDLRREDRRPVCYSELEGGKFVGRFLDKEECNSQEGAAIWKQTYLLYTGGPYAKGIEVCVGTMPTPHSAKREGNIYAVPRQLVRQGESCTAPGYRKLFSFRGMESPPAPMVEVSTCITDIRWGALGNVAAAICPGSSHSGLGAAVSITALDASKANYFNKPILRFCIRQKTGESQMHVHVGHACTEPGWTIEHSFIVPVNATGSPFCLGRHDPDNNRPKHASLNMKEVKNMPTVLLARRRCDEVQGLLHEAGGHSVMPEDVPELWTSLGAL